ncbi:MAG: hypothetical protein ACLP50_21275, partial [Solirubrobacteraceae bacterium]
MNPLPLEHRRRHRIGLSAAALVTGLLSILVVAAMVGASVVTREDGNSHRQAQVVAEQLLASSQAMSAFQWRAEAEGEMSKLNFSFDGGIMQPGLQLLTQLNTELHTLRRVAPGEDTRVLTADVDTIQSVRMDDFSSVNSPGGTSSRELELVMKQFQPVLDRLDADAERSAHYQAEVAALSDRKSLWTSISSMLLGVVLLAGLGRRLAGLHRRVAFDTEIRAVERRSEERVRALVEHSSDVVTVLDADLRVRWQAAS